MKKHFELLMQDWYFTGPDKKQNKVNLPHTWNNIDGQDGGNDYYRGTCTYEKQFECPSFDKETQRVYLEFDGVNSSAEVILNGSTILVHHNGYSTFRKDITDELKESNDLVVFVDNSVNDSVYPQKADFTFYGGIYRDVKLVTVSKEHFDLSYYGGNGTKITPGIDSNGNGVILSEIWLDKNLCETEYQVKVELFDAEKNCVASGVEKFSNYKAVSNITVENPHLWNGIQDPYLYSFKATLLKNNKELDETECNIGIRTFKIDPKTGFYLNGKKYPLHGVSRHQDRKNLGNAISYEMMDEDMNLIREVGANTIRLAHYQHNQYFYDLCDKYGMIVWAEIPYISAHLLNGNENTHEQMKELIVQNYNHPSIVTWGISNEITISSRYKKKMLENHKSLQKLCHEMDSTRPTTMACYAMCGPFHPVTRITDLINWNLYLGWYVPILALNDVLMLLYHLIHPNQPFGYSEYGAEGMPNLHTAKPRRGDHTEEYQAKYHEYMLNCFKRHPYMWATYVWNMFDFAADARNQGGEPGMNHKGLVTFDRQIKKDSFYVYKAYWSEEPFVHICGKRFEHRHVRFSEIKVYTNQDYVELYVNGKKTASGKGQKILRFTVDIAKDVKVEVKAGKDKNSLTCTDSAEFIKTNIFLEQYKLIASKSDNWV